MSQPAAQALARLSVQVLGEGPDVIFLPGLMSSGEAWRDIAEGLSGRYRAHLCTVAGFAGVPAGANAAGPILTPVVEELAAAIRSMARAPAVVGHSMGGLMGQLLAGTYPDLVSRLLVVDALPFYPMVFDPSATAESARPQAEATRDNLLNLTNDAFVEHQRGWVAPMVKGEADRRRILDWSLVSDRSVGARGLYEAMTIDARPLLPKITARTRVVYAFDPAMGIPAEALDGLLAMAYADLPEATMKRIDGSLHFIMYDQPDALAAEVAAFLA